MYFVHGAHLLQKKKALVTGYFEAWTHGPVHPAIYSEFKDFGSEPITRKAFRKNIRTGELLDINIELDSDTISICNSVINSLRNLSPGQLVALSHASGSAWHKVYRRSKSEHMLGLRMSNKAILDGYKSHWFLADKLEVANEPTEDTPLTYYRLS
nr:type II toxin-antitoxin system antitoxin SocA domain-containing protein [Novosphingobium flavum]